SFVEIYFLRAAHRSKDPGILPGRLALSQEKITAILQGGMEDGEQRSLEHRLEIDHHIPAAYEIQLAERRIREHIVGSENNHPPDFLGDHILVVFLCKKFREAVPGHVIQNTVCKY